MMKKRNSGIKLIKSPEGIPSIKASVETTKGVVSGCFYIDTGATSSFIIDSLSEDKGIKSCIISNGNCSSETSIVKVKYHVGGINRIGYFHKIKNNELGVDASEGILGILGTDFLIDTGAIMDFSTESLYFKNAHSICKKFHFSLMDGIKEYNLPLVIISASNKEYVCLIDSASELNMMVKSAGYTPDALSSKKRVFISGLIGTMSGTMIKEKIAIRGVFDECEENYIREEDFNIIFDHSCFLELNCEDLVVTAVLGCHFLWDNHCIIDFQKRELYV